MSQKHKRTLPHPPHSPVEVQAVAGRPLLPHVYVLPHGAVTATQHRADSSTSQTHPQFGPRRCIHQRSPSHPLLTGQKLSAKHKLSKRWALADCSHHCCLAACLPARLSRSSLRLFLPSLSLCCAWQGHLASALQLAKLRQHLQTNAVLFWP